MGSQLSPQEVLSCYPRYEETIPALLVSRRQAAPESPALNFGSRTWTYAQLDDASNMLGAALSLRGMQKGHRVALVCGNADLDAVLFLAAAKLGALFIPLDPSLPEESLQSALQCSRAECIAARDEDMGRFFRLSEDLHPLPWLLSLDDLGYRAPSVAGVISAIAEFAGGRSRASRPGLEPDDPVVALIHAAGTAGAVKGVVHSHRGYLWAAEVFVERMQLQPTDRLLSVLPMYHAETLFCTLGGGLAAGAMSIAAGDFALADFWRIAAATGATQLTLNAATASLLAQQPRSELDCAHSIRKLHVERLSEAASRVFREEFQVPALVEGYGVPELPEAFASSSDGVRKNGSIGRPARHPRLATSHVEVRLESDTGQPTPAGQIGELLVRSPGMFCGYLDDPERTRRAFRKDWFLTGDYMRMDEDGDFYFISRKSVSAASTPRRRSAQP